MNQLFIVTLACIWYIVGSISMAYMLKKIGKLSDGDLVACSVAGLLGPIVPIVLLVIKKKILNNIESDYLDDTCVCGKKMYLEQFSVEKVVYKCECGNERTYL